MGLGLGAAFPAGYSALTEFTPPTKRGKYQSYVGLIANCGTLVASAMNMVVLPMLGWRPVFVICGCIGFVVVVLCFAFLDESPRWLAMKGHNAEADKIVSRLEEKTSAKGRKRTCCIRGRDPQARASRSCQGAPLGFPLQEEDDHPYAYGYVPLLHDERAGVYRYFLDSYHFDQEWL